MHTFYICLDTFAYAGYSYRALIYPCFGYYYCTHSFYNAFHGLLCLWLVVLISFTYIKLYLLDFFYAYLERESLP